MRPPGGAGSRRKRSAPSSGFSVGSGRERADGGVAREDAEPDDGAHLDLSGLGGDDSALSVEQDELKAYVRSKFGNHAEEVLDIMR
eukprot:6182300-Pleurochrysis_carterae.AAC.1